MTKLWVVDDRRVQEAAGVIQQVIEEPAAPEESAPWMCPHCGEEVEATFAVCWNCGAERPEEA